MMPDWKKEYQFRHTLSSYEALQPWEYKIAEKERGKSMTKLAVTEQASSEWQLRPLCHER